MYEFIILQKFPPKRIKLRHHSLSNLMNPSLNLIAVGAPLLHISSAKSQHVLILILFLIQSYISPSEREFYYDNIKSIHAYFGYVISFPSQ